MKKDFEKILSILTCPKCKGELRLIETWFICYQCKLKYPIKKGIPILLIEEAHRLQPDER
ncbi:MAG: Trm112 family protein [Aquificae bacterium]|nr:Trm112 family protein [Aquificota bacterium]